MYFLFFYELLYSALFPVKKHSLPIQKDEHKVAKTPSLRVPLVTHIILPAFIRNVSAIFAI